MKNVNAVEDSYSSDSSSCECICSVLIADVNSVDTDGNPVYCAMLILGLES